MSKFFFVVLCLLPPSLFAQSLLSPGDVLRGVYRVTEPSFGGDRLVHSVPLPEGDWTVLRTQEYEATITGGGSARIPMRTVSLASITTDNHLAMGVFVRSNRTSQQIKWTDEPCRGTDFLYANKFDGGIWNQKCLTIKLETYLQTNNAAQNRSREFLASRRVKYSGNALTASISRMDDRGGYLTVMVYLFPDRYGFENPVESIVARHPWHASLFMSDPDKVKFIRAFSRWAESYGETIFKFYDDPSLTLEKVNGFFYQRSEN